MACWYEARFLSPVLHSAHHHLELYSRMFLSPSLASAGRGPWATSRVPLVGQFFNCKPRYLRSVLFVPTLILAGPDNGSGDLIVSFGEQPNERKQILALCTTDQSREGTDRISLRSARRGNPDIPFLGSLQHTTAVHRAAVTSLLELVGCEQSGCRQYSQHARTVAEGLAVAEALATSFDRIRCTLTPNTTKA